MDARSDQRVALLSIRPEFAVAIMRGEKLVEFRRRPPSGAITHVVVYATAPVSKIVGWFEVAGIESDSPSGLWKRFASDGGIGRSAFFDYYQACEVGSAIRVGPVTIVDPAVPLGDIDPRLVPPQSFRYLADEKFDLLLAGQCSPPNLA